MNKYILLMLLVCLGLFNKTAQAEDSLNLMLQPEQISEDLDQWLAFLDNTHPQLSYTVSNVDAFYADIEKLKSSITTPISVQEFWKKIAVFNPVLNDGHTVIKLPKLKVLANQHVKNGGGLFPFNVVFDQDKLVIKSKFGGAVTKYRGNEITHINGHKTSDFILPLLQRTHGDSERFRKAILQRRLAEYIWLYYGDFKAFDLTLTKYGQQQTKVFAASFEEFNLDEPFAEQFTFEILDKNNALITINTFSWGAEYKEVIAFLHKAFAKIQQNNIEHIIIDVRENGGGDDAIWIEGILPYIADKTWRTGSNNKFRVLKGRANKDRQVGDIIESENSFRDVDNSVEKFTGEVSVLISAFTYSSAILFANVIQDHQFGQLVGEATGGKSGQTGGTRAITLTHSKLKVVSPFFYLERPKGGDNHNPVKPDVVINYDKTIPEQLVNKLINQGNVKAGKAQ
ncbi:S41 family peptidase [Colwelliaceae bacterium 6441]